MDSEIQKRIEKRGLVISRIPTWAKEIFINRAEEEFCDDYGMCLVAMLKESSEYNQLKQMFFNNELNVQLLLDGKSHNEVSGEETIRFGNGKIIKRIGGKNE